VDRATRRAEASTGVVVSDRELELGAHFFRGVGAGYVLRVASEHEWTLHPVLRSHPRRRLRLRHTGRSRTRAS
jgi:hypothetical protein